MRCANKGDTKHNWTKCQLNGGIYLLMEPYLSRPPMKISWWLKKVLGALQPAPRFIDETGSNQNCQRRRIFATRKILTNNNRADESLFSIDFIKCVHINTPNLASVITNKGDCIVIKFETGARCRFGFAENYSKTLDAFKEFALRFHGWLIWLM